MTPRAPVTEEGTMLLLAGARVGVAVGAGSAAAEVGAGSEGSGAEVGAAVGWAMGRGCPEASVAGILSTAPTFNLLDSVSPFALKITPYLGPLPYIFCAIIQGLSPGSTV